MVFKDILWLYNVGISEHSIGGMGMREKLRCMICNEECDTWMCFHGCQNCLEQGKHSPLEVVYDYSKIKKPVEHFVRGESQKGIWCFGDLLPNVKKENVISIDEGGTPLTKINYLSEQLGVDLYIKNESTNPTWSFKDRNLSVAISVAKELGYKKVVGCSTGNYGTSQAAYASVAGLECVILCPHEASEVLKLTIGLHGGKTIVTDKKGRGHLIYSMVKNYGWYPVVPAIPYPIDYPLANPFGVEGYKSIGYEIALQSKHKIPDWVFVPVGLGDGIYGTWKGLKELNNLGLLAKLPKMVGCQSDMAPALVRSVQNRLDYVTTVTERPSLAVSIIEDTAGIHSLRAVYESGGTAVSVSDGEISNSIRLLAKGGIFAEAASACTLACLIKMCNEGLVGKGDTVVCVITSSGVKWTNALHQLAPPPSIIKPNINELKKVIEL